MIAERRGNSHVITDVQRQDAEAEQQNRMAS